MLITHELKNVLQWRGWGSSFAWHFITEKTDLKITAAKKVTLVKIVCNNFFMDYEFIIGRFLTVLFTKAEILQCDDLCMHIVVTTLTMKL